MWFKIYNGSSLYGLLPEVRSLRSISYRDDNEKISQVGLQKSESTIHIAVFAIHHNLPWFFELQILEFGI